MCEHFGKYLTTYRTLQENVAHFNYILHMISSFNFSVSVTIGCLVLHQRYQRRYARYLLLVQDVSSREVASDVECDDTGPETIRATSVTDCRTSEGKLLMLMGQIIHLNLNSALEH
jgi:hypothetical protein